jgi:predicted signal transduction protein with EAL and GGDEF domain
MVAAMDTFLSEFRPSILTLIEARRSQLGIRLASAVLIVGIFQLRTGLGGALTWLALYASVQLLEFWMFHRSDSSRDLAQNAERMFFALAMANSAVFTSFGVLLAFSGTWGILCAGIIWSGTIAHATINSGGSRHTLQCALLPPVLAFIALPGFVFRDGGNLIDCITIAAAGLINGFGTVAMWNVYQNMLKSATHARELGRLAQYDTETGLPNRAALEQRIDVLASTAPGIVVVAAIGIDRFIHLRDAIGHASMVELIGQLAHRLTSAFDDQPVMRLSSGHLGLAFVARDMMDAFHLASTLQSAVTRPLQLRDTRVDVSVTIGLSEAADALQHAADLAIPDRALIAVEQAREARRHIARFDATLYGNPGATLSLMSEMSRALHNGQMDIAYQPKYHVQTGAIVGAEALVRWTHPERGPLRPDLYVEMAEQTGHIGELTEWVLRGAVADQRRLHEAGFDLSVAVNWSGQLLDDVAFTEAALDIARDACGGLCLEVTETAIIGNAGLARQTLQRFRAAGLQISIDDYGSGLSSMAYLKNIPADELKIDKAFVLNMATDPVDTVLVRAAVSLAHSLGLRVVAEGVEQQAALDLLREMGCDLAQGYLIARPMPLQDLIAYLGNRAAEAIPALPQNPD